MIYCDTEVRKDKDQNMANDKIKLEGHLVQPAHHLVDLSHLGKKQNCQLGSK